MAESFLEVLEKNDNKIIENKENEQKVNINQRKSTKEPSIAEKEYAQLDDNRKLSFIERELLRTVEKIDDSIDALDMYERQTNKIPYGIYDLKNKFLETRRQSLKNLFDIISHKQKLEKEDKGDNFTDIVKI